MLVRQGPQPMNQWESENPVKVYESIPGIDLMAYSSSSNRVKSLSFIVPDITRLRFRLRANCLKQLVPK